MGSKETPLINPAESGHTLNWGVGFPNFVPKPHGTGLVSITGPV